MKANNKRRLKVVNRRRFYRSILLIVLLCSTIFISLNFADFNTERKYIQITVGQGDTVWSIASNFNHKYFEDHKDIRKIIHYINKENDISDNIIYPGDIILIPTDI